MSLRRCHGLLQRLAWTQALLARFAHTAMPPWDAGRTLLRGIWSWMHRSQWFASQIQVSWQTSTAVTRHGRDRTLFLPLTPATAERTTLLQTRLTRESRWQSTTLLRTNFFRHSLQNQLREVTRHTLATTVVNPAAALRAASQLALGTSTASRKWSGAGDLELLPVARRVLRQNRRIEERTAPPQAMLLRRSAAPPPEPDFIESDVPAQARPRGVTAASAPTPVPHGFNITQITDEVVRQLDSRLVAARERFGKI
jgi:hypothetical protein